MALAITGALLKNTECPDVERLAITRLSLKDFRNYQSLRLDIDPRPVIIVGPNGAGKTNILESISCLSNSRGLRGAKLKDMARSGLEDGAKHWFVAANIESIQGPVSLGVSWEDGNEQLDVREKRDYRINGTNVSSQSAILEHIAVVWMTPAQDRLFIESPSGRRRFVDNLVLSFNPSHASRIAAYDKSRRDRARLLRENTSDIGWLDAIERGMSENAIAISAARLDLLSRIQEDIMSEDGPFPKPVLGMEGLIENWLSSQPALAVEERYIELLANMRVRDTETGTSEGPHRSDFKAALSQGELEASQASTGEQKAILIAVLLAHARLLSRLRGMPPIMLLDEVIAHLDSGRREALFSAILSIGAQAWMTGTDVNLFSPLFAKSQTLHVNNSILMKE